MKQATRWRRHILPKRRLTFSWLHGGISQKTELFKSVKTSNPTVNIGCLDLQKGAVGHCVQFGKIKTVNVVQKSSDAIYNTKWIDHEFDDQWMRVRFPSWTRNICFSLLCSDQTGSETHPASCSLGIRGCSTCVKHSGDVVNYPPLCTKVKNTWSFISIPSYNKF
jgi:hypothetical protein